MSAPVVVIVTEPISASDPTLQAMVAATSEGLPSGTRLLVMAEDYGDADVVAVVRWADDAHTRATLHTRTRDGHSADRVVAFAAGDPDRERGRALGYAIVAMIPEELRLQEPLPREPPPREPPRLPPEAHGDEELPTGRVWIDGTLQASTAFAGSATLAGGGLAARLPLRPVALRVGAAFRAGSVPEANATSLLLRADVGLALWTVAVDPRLSVGMRSGLVVFHHALARTAPDGSSASGTHTLIGTEALAEASWTLGSRFALIGALGAEVAFGTTHVLVGSDQVSLLPPVRPLAELGVRAIF